MIERMEESSESRPRNGRRKNAQILKLSSTKITWRAKSRNKSDTFPSLRLNWHQLNIFVYIREYAPSFVVYVNNNLMDLQNIIYIYIYIFVERYKICWRIFFFSVFFSKLFKFEKKEIRCMILLNACFFRHFVIYWNRLKDRRFLFFFSCFLLYYANKLLF